MAKLARRLILAAAAVAPLLLAGCERAPDAPPRASFNAIDITGADYANHLDLPDADGRMRHLSDFKGKIAVVFFGYTQCPDV
jgi:protein SCO1